MIQQNIYIINLDPLYEILDEIKDNLLFKIGRCNDLGKLTEDSNFILKNSLIILNFKDHLLFNNINVNNILVLPKSPIKLDKLIELINIELIKSKFNYQSNIAIQNYTLNLNSKFISQDNINLKLTEKEIEIILYLYENKEKQSVLKLQKNIWNYASGIETHTVETHIYRLRKKISDSFNDEDLILSHKDGYFIN